MRFSRLVPITLALAMCMLLAPRVGAANDDDKSNDKKDQQAQNVSEADRVFAKDAAMGGRMEVRLGKLAQNNAESEDVKQFGQMMVTDHTAANKELNKLAKQKSLDLKAAKGEHSDMYGKLKDLKGAEFDKQYMAMMIEDHTEDVKKFEQEAQSGSDPELKAYASKTLDTLKKHLDKAKEVGAKVGAPGAPAAG